MKRSNWDRIWRYIATRDDVDVAIDDLKPAWIREYQERQESVLRTRR